MSSAFSVRQSTCFNGVRRHSSVTPGLFVKPLEAIASRSKLSIGTSNSVVSSAENDGSARNLSAVDLPGSVNECYELLIMIQQAIEVTRG